MYVRIYKRNSHSWWNFFCTIDFNTEINERDFSGGHHYSALVTLPICDYEYYNLTNSI